MIENKLMEDGPALHFVASLGAVCPFFSNASDLADVKGNNRY
jgi:hypothetical protein